MSARSLQLFLILILCTYVSGISAADQRWRLDTDVLLTRFDSGRGDDFHSTQSVSARAGLYLNKYFAVESGLMLSNRVIDDTRKDIAGYYQAGLEQQGILLGMRAGYRYTAPYELFARIGLSYARTELEIEEAFPDDTRAISVSATDRTLGYYFAFGGTHFITPTIEIHLDISRQTQPDLFADRSRYPFDLDAASFGIGIGLLF